MRAVPPGREGLFWTRGLLVVLVSLLTQLGPLFAEHTPQGVPPVITSRQEDVVVSSDVFIDGFAANLVLSCEATGTPAPTIAWFTEPDAGPVGAEFVMSDGRLVMNVTMMDVATTIYYCTATNSIGPEGSLTATARSRNISVTYTFFEGFQNMTIRTVELRTVEGGAVAMECDFLDARPRPIVEWFMNNGSTAIVENTDQSQILFLDGGRFLFIRSLTSQQRSGFFHCEVANAFLGKRPQRAPTTYTLIGEFPLNTVEPYLRDQSVTTTLGDPVTVVLAAASHTSDGSRAVSLSCTDAVENTNVMVDVRQDSIAEFTGLPGVDNMLQNFTCTGGVLGGATLGPVTYSFNVTQPASITSPAEDDPSLTDRERLVGGGEVVYVCENQGIPSPGDVIWYYNGEFITPDSNGVVTNGNQLVIPDPQVANSGVYQCMVGNDIDGVVRDDGRDWVLEVREPVPPSVNDLTSTNPLAVSDRLEGTVIVADPATNATINLTITVVVAADPCPEVQWRFAGTDISDASPDYSIDDPCGVGSSSPFTFTLIIASLTSAISGQYSALFSNLDPGSTSLPNLFVTVPVPVEVERLELNVEDTDIECLLGSRNVVMTCVISGFPRPGILFRKEGSEIMPGMEEFERIANISLDQIRITDVEMSDEAQYTCEARQENPMTRVLNPLFCTQPRLVGTMVRPSEEQSPVISVGGDLELECDFDGIPTPDVQWTRDGEVLTQTSTVFIATSVEGVARLTMQDVTVDFNGIYRCTAVNDAGTVSATFTVDRIMETNEPILSTAAIIGIAAGGVGFFLLVVLLILLLVCVYLCAKRGKAGSADFSYNVDSVKPAEYGDGRGNVDADSCDGGQPEAFDPDYDSVPTRRPNEPPPYKITPSYQHGASLAGEDLEMIKYPPQDESFVSGVPPYSRPGHDNGFRQTPNADDFLSEDAQFV